MRTKHKSVSEIASVLKRSKRASHQVLARDNDFKRKFLSGKPRVTLREDGRIRNLTSTGNYHNFRCIIRR